MDDTEDIKKKIVKIYKRHNPEKVEEVDNLLVKYAGQEKELLKRIKDKYLPSAWDNSNYNWKYNLKHFPDQKADESKRQKAVWNVESSLKAIQHLLEEHAKIIGGIIDMQNSKGHQVLVVRRDMNQPLGTKASVESHVEKMQDLIHKRYQQRRDTHASSEHERRKLEKDRDKAKKKAMDKGRGRKGAGPKRW